MEKDQIEGLVCMMGNRYTSRFKVHDDGTISSQICNPQGEVIKETEKSYSDELEAYQANQNLIDSWRKENS